MTYTVDLDTHVTVRSNGDQWYPNFWINFTNHIRSDIDYVAKSGGMFDAINAYLKSAGITRALDSDTNWHIILTFESEADFLVFKLKWS